MKIIELILNNWEIITPCIALLLASEVIGETKSLKANSIFGVIKQVVAAIKAKKK